jgi:hypothetical protein
MLLNRSRSAVFVEMAFGDFRENYIERVHHVCEIVLKKIESKVEKSSTQEEVRNVDL